METPMKFLFTILISIFLLIACGNMKESGKTKEIKYEITGSARSVSVTLSNGEGGTEQFNDVSVPWKKTYSIKNGFVYLSAQNQGSSGTVTVKIYVDGKVIKESSSSGEYVIASASDSIY